MFVKRIEITNFKSTAHLEVDLTKINLFVGDPGNGKSTIIDALDYAFTGNLEDKISEYVKHSPIQEKKFTIRVLFDHLNKDYDYTIEGFESSQTNKKLIVDGNIEDAFINSDATKHIAELIDPTITSYSNISKQHKATSLLSEKPSPRLEKLKKILKINQLDPAVVLIEEEAVEIKEKIIIQTTKKENLQSKTYNYVDYVDEPNVDINELRKTQSELLEKEVAWQKENTKNEVYLSELNTYKSNQTKVSDLTSQKQNKEIKIKEIKDTLVDVVELTQEESLQLEELEASNLKYIQEKASLEVQWSSYNNYLKSESQYQADIKEYDVELSNLDTPMRTVEPKYSEQDVEGFRKEYVDLKSSLAIKENEYEAIKNGECPTCHSKFETKDIGSLQESIASLKQDLITLEEKAKNAKDGISKYKETLAKNELISSKKENILENKNKVLIKLELLEKVKEPTELIDDLQTKINNITLDKEILLDIKSESLIITSKNKEGNDAIQSLEKEIEQLITQIKMLSDLQEPAKFEFTIRFNRDSLNDIVKEIKDFDEIVIKNENITKLNETVKKDEANDKKVLDELDGVLYSLKHRDTLLKEAKKFLQKGFTSYLVKEGTEYIQEEMNSILLRTYGKFGVSFEQTRSGVEYYYTSPTNDKLCSVNTLSGYEKCVFAVSQRLALLSLQENIKFLICDEIDSDANEEYSIELYENILKEDLDQVFIITHHNATKEFIANKGATVVEMENGNSI